MLLSPLVLLSALIVPISIALAQGSLTPPGAPGPTFKTLQQVEPRLPISVIPTNLTVPGSYYLTTNLTQTTIFSAIVIGADDITIDLNGFALIGTNSSFADGVTFGGTLRKNVCLKNGTIRNWRTGVSLSGGGNMLIDRVRVYGNTENGINSFISVTVTDCYSADNGFNGILLSNSGLIRDCEVRNNGRDGIQVASGAVITGNRCTGVSSVASTNAGIRATSQGNFIDGNHISFYGNAIVVSGSGNVIIRNTTRLTANDFVISSGNLTGPTNTIGTGLSSSPYANLVH
jgi:hypothetical protein